jgi:unsaturated rhamnogalacturonyl hydrolase
MPRFKLLLGIIILACAAASSIPLHAGLLSGSAAQPTSPDARAANDALIRRVADRTLDLRLEGWDWDTGVALYGLMAAWRATDEQVYFDAVQAWVGGFIARGLPPITHPNQAVPGIATLMLYEETGEEKYLAASQQLATYLLHSAPRTQAGALYHYEDQLWIDTTFMAGLFLARFSRITGDPRYAELAADQFLLHAERLQDRETGLFFHGWDESEGGHMSGAFWQRGNGWGMAAGVELLDQLPPDHPARADIRAILARQVAGLLPLQDDSGLWHTVVDQPDFYLETSGAAAIGYSLLRGLDQGWLTPSDGASAALRALHGVETKIAPDGTVIDVSAGTGVAPTLADYNGISHHAIQPWGQGLTLLLLTQRSYGFKLAASPPLVVVEPGATAWTDLIMSDIYGSLPETTMSLSSELGTLTSSFSPPERPNPFDTTLESRVTVTTTASTPVGTHTLDVSATAGDLQRTVPVTLRVATSVARVHLPLVAQHHDDQADVIRITDEPGNEWQPTLSKDGKLAFTSNRSGTWRVYLQRPGEAAQRLTVPLSLEEDRPLFAADGRLALSVRTESSNWDAFIFGGQPQSWFPLGHPTSNELHPAISPDGRFMTYVADESGNWEVYVIELRRVDPQLTFHVAADRVPAWSPDGQEIIFRSEWQGNSDIYVMDTQGRQLRRLTDDPAADAWPSFSPDGQWILFQSDRAGSNDVYVMDRQGGRVTRLTRQPGDDLTPAWTPDGEQILFASDRDGDLDIYRMRFNPPHLRLRYPDHGLADDVWQAVDSFVDTYPPADMFPGYDAQAGGPARDKAAANVETACHDFPDLPELFGPGAHHASCGVDVANYLGLYHAARGRRGGSSEDIAWAQYYLDVALDGLAEFVYGPADSPTGTSYRDTLAAIWQNPLRAVNTTLVADLLHQQGTLDQARQERAAELLSGVARAWYAEFWLTGEHPNPGVPFTTRTAPEVEAKSLAGHQVVSTFPWTFEWDADKGNTAAEEVAWMGSGVMLATRVLAEMLDDAEAISTAARHYVDFALTYNRPDPTHGGTIRTLNSETTGGEYGQRRYWLENHAPDMPSIPYAGFTWQSINDALLASHLGQQQPWPDLVPDDDQWRILLQSAGETMRAADGTFLVDFTPGQGIGFNLANFPAWWAPCGAGQPGRQYVQYLDPEGGPDLYLSEIGHPAGVDLLPAGWAIMRIAAQRHDVASYGVWQDRLNRILAEYISNPPDPNWASCKTAPYVSDNPAYHWSRMLAVYLHAFLGASGYQVAPWTP